MKLGNGNKDGDCVAVSAPVAMLSPSSARLVHWGRPGKGYLGSPCIMTYNCMSVYNYLKKNVDSNDVVILCPGKVK